MVGRSAALDVFCIIIILFTVKRSLTFRKVPSLINVGRI